MSRIGIDYDSVKQTAIKLLSQGIAPSVQKVREQLGTGSNTTIAEHLKRWREEHAQKIIYHLSADMPKELISAFEVLWQTAMEHAQNQLALQKQMLDEERATSQQLHIEAEKEAHRLKQQLEAYTTQLSQANAMAHQSHIDLAILNERLDKQQTASTLLAEQYEARLKRIYAEKDELIIQYQQLQKAMKELQEQLNTQSLQSQNLLAQQTALHEQSESRWLRIIDKTRQEAKDNQKKTEKLCDTKEAKIKNLTAKVSMLEQQVFEKSSLLDRALERQTVLEQENKALKTSESKQKKPSATRQTSKEKR
ncbi:MAG: DNA-binding protein [Gammaproteobacteria bacterium]|nr:DNA-binding protein [Gammaproteobacteria bacterium]